LLPISEYWETARKFYSSYEEGLSSPATEIYKFEMPGGQYTNLKAQVESVGLGRRWPEVRDKYHEVNKMLGDIVKVTPSSKMVGDFAIFMVQNELTAENIVQRGESLAFPDSVVSYFEGRMGQPQGGFPADIQAIVLKGKTPITGRPGEHLTPTDFNEMKNKMKAFCPEPNGQDVVSYCLYPKVVEDFFRHKTEFSDLSNVDTPVFFNGLAPGETTEVEIEEGKVLLIKLIHISEPDEESKRTVEFELNGVKREVHVVDTYEANIQAKAGAPLAPTADPTNPNDVGATLPGMISKVMVKSGDSVKKNDVVAIIEAMKMETTILSKATGVVGEVFVKEGQSVKAGELILRIG